MIVEEEANETTTKKNNVPIFDGSGFPNHCSPVEEVEFTPTYKTESAEKEIRGCFSIGRNIIGKCFALKTCIVIVNKQTKSFIILSLNSKFSRQKSQNKIQVFKLVPYTTRIHTHKHTKIQ